MIKYINLHTHNYTAKSDIIELVNQYPLEFDVTIPTYSIGIHPWKINEATISEELTIVESKLGLENCLAIGECGLDKRIEVPFELQLSVFENQLKLAEKYRKPVVIHCVAAFQEVIERRQQMNITVPMIIHGFSKSIELAQQLIDHGFYMSFGKYLLRNPELETVFTNMPLEKCFLETDTIDEGIREVYALAAKYRKLELEDLKIKMDENFTKVFRNK